MNLDLFAAGLGPLVAVKSLVLLSITWVVAVVLRRHSAAAAHRAWAWGFVGCLLLPLITLAPGWTLPEMATSEPVLSAPNSLPAEALAYSTGADSIAPQNVGSDSTIDVASDVPLGNAKPLPAPAPKVTWGPEAVIRGIWIVWGSIALLLTLRLVWQHVALWNLVRRATRLESGEWTQLLTEAAGALRLAHAPPIRMSAEIASPLCAGLLRPVILLPAGCEAWSPERRRMVLLHELAHVKRRDVLIQAMVSLVAAGYWFNPVAWVGNVQMRRLREVACDDMVLNCGANSRDYAEVLVDIARLCRRGLTSPAVAMARGSNVEQRVLAILDAGGRRLSLSRRAAGVLAMGIVCVVVIVGSAQVGAQVDRPEGAANAGPAAAEEDSQSPESSEPDNGVDPQLLAIAKRGIANLEGIESGHLRFRFLRTGSRFKPGLTPERCAGLMAKYDLVGRPEVFGALIAELYEDGLVDNPQPAEAELHFERALNDIRIREAVKVGDRRDVHVRDRNLAQRWDDANSQLTIAYSKEDRVGIIRPHEFWCAVPPIRSPAETTLLTIEEGIARIEDTSSGAFLLTADAETGYLLTMDQIRGNRTEQHRWLGWAQTPEGLPYPRLVTKLLFENDQLRRATIYVLTDVNLNLSLDDATFKLGAPAGATIVDKRRGNWVFRSEGEIYDATSEEQVRRAAKEFTELKVEEVSEIEAEAIAALREVYTLKEGQLVRHFGPPYHSARRYLGRMVHARVIVPHQKDDFRYCNLIEWQDGEYTEKSQLGVSPHVGNIVGVIVGHPATDTQIPREIAERSVAGDFLYRGDAAPGEKAEALAEILSQKLGQPIRLTFEDIERTVYVARGQVTIDPAKFRKFEDLPIIEVNGGDYEGDHGEVIGWGTFAEHVDQLAEYIGTRIIDETEPSEVECAWSRRWYDRTGTPKEKRFQLDPEAVLQKVSDQTGVEFEPKQQTVRMLVLETE